MSVSKFLNCIGSTDLFDNSYEDQLKMSLVQKLRVIKRCIEEKEFSFHITKLRHFKKDSFKKNHSTLKSYKIKEIDFGEEQIANKLSKVFLNKPMIELCSIEIQYLIKLVEESIEVIAEDKLHQAVLKPGFDKAKHDKLTINDNFSQYNFISSLSIFSDSKTSTSLKTEYGVNTRGNRKINKNISQHNLISSLSI